MYMDESEIVGKFRKADNKKEILQILADLNGCSRDDMKSYLLEHGVSEDDFPKRGRKAKVAKEEEKNEVIKEVPQMKLVRTVDQLMEISDLTPEEQGQVDRVLSIPEPVRLVVADRIEVLTAKIMEMEKERDCLCDYLGGVEHGEAG